MFEVIRKAVTGILVSYLPCCCNFAIQDLCPSGDALRLDKIFASIKAETSRSDISS